MKKSTKTICMMLVLALTLMIASTSVAYASDPVWDVGQSYSGSYTLNTLEVAAASTYIASKISRNTGSIYKAAEFVTVVSFMANLFPDKYKYYYVTDIHFSPDGFAYYTTTQMYTDSTLRTKAGSETRGDIYYISVR